MENLNTKNLYQAELFKNRLSKNYRQLKKWARKNRISSYRLYDKDIPEVPLALDLYEFLPEEITDKEECARFYAEQNNSISLNDAHSRETLKLQKERTYVTLYLYERPYEKERELEEEWLNLMAESACSVLEIQKDHVITKTRKKLSGSEEGRNEQYEKFDTQRHIQGLVQEQGQLFKINLTDYLDSGLFFDHRVLRKIIRESSSGKNVLNLFCYTGSFSVYAAEGNARLVESVDLSNTYIDWAKENFKINSLTNTQKYFFTRQDVREFLKQKNEENKNTDSSNQKYFDIIILDPPTFSNSKKTQNILDITKDWSELCAECIKLLRSKGCLYFSTNSKKLVFNKDELKKLTDNLEYSITDISSKTIPEDYRNSKIHRCWKIELA